MEIFETVTETVTDITASAADAIQTFFEEETVTTRKNVITTCTICALLGIVAGFVFSPIKKGFYFNISNNGNISKPEKGKKGCCKEASPNEKKQCCCKKGTKRKEH